MHPDKDKALCAKYPLLFQDRNKSIQETCMAWGFDVGDGWHTLIDTLCGNIQHHIDNEKDNRDRVIIYNEMLAAAKQDSWDKFDEYYKIFDDSFKQKEKEAIKNGSTRLDFKQVPEEIVQVVVSQVKEKYGGLRFYYYGGDDYVDGLVHMAESMSYTICENCSGPRDSEDDSERGWIYALCSTCKEKRFEST